MKDLFGTEHDEPDEYTSYMASKKWAEKRSQKLREAGYCCQRCGLSQYSVDLQVHHFTYKNLGHEPMEDLQVVCPECHYFADAEREIEQAVVVEEEKKSGALAQGFTNWISRGDTHRMSGADLFRAKQKFLKMLFDKSGHSYSLDLRPLGYNDPNPEWKP
jgi:HNH endonuclease